ncbi:MAG: biotin--[acetyl-CoA-carboxylase] ligase, partial [Pseudomonadota bacterium]
RAACWYTADKQTAGVGRRGRAWVQKAGNFAGTLLWPVTSGDIKRPALFSFLAAVALCDALEACGVPTSVTQVKWPNDVLVDGKKVAGILPELVRGEAALAVVIGMGVNLAYAPKGPGINATAVCDHAQRVPDPASFRMTLDKTLNAVWSHYRRGGFEAIRQAWLSRAAGLGGQLTARLEGSTLEGVFHGVGADGELLLDIGGDIRPVLAADVFLKD